MYNDWWEGYGVAATSEHPKEACMILAELCKTDLFRDFDAFFEEGYGPVVKNQESMDVIQILDTKTVTVNDQVYASAFDGEGGFNSILNDIIAGKETPRVGLEKAEPLVNAKLKEIIESRKK